MSKNICLDCHTPEFDSKYHAVCEDCFMVRMYGIIETKIKQLQNTDGVESS